MVDEVSIVNQALGLLNANRIVAFTDTSKEGELATDFYATLRDAVLEEADWSFAINNLDITADGTPPVDKTWSTRYLIPTEVIRVISVNGKSTKSQGKAWVREGQYIYTNYGICAAKLISSITNPNFFSAMFVQALVNRIAWSWAMPITKSKKLSDTFEHNYIESVNNAATMDGMQGSPESTGRGRLVDTRYHDRSAAGPFV
jgi:hypothetical protein